MTPSEALRAAADQFRAGRPAAAAALCQAVLRAVPDQPEALHLLGVAAAALGRLAAAERALSLAVAVRPDWAEAWGNLALLMRRGGRHAEAARLQDRAVRLAPGSAEARLNRGTTRLLLGEPARAEADFREAARLAPADPRPYHGLGVALRQQGRLAASLGAQRRALLLRPDHADAQRELGHAKRQAGDLPGAQEAYRRAARLAPRSGEAAGDLLAVSLALCDWRRYDVQVRCLKDCIDGDGGVVPPLLPLAVDTTAAQQDRAARRFYATLAGPAADPAPPLPARPAAPGGRLHVGYLSADFHDHATAHLTAELFELHDRSRFLVSAFSYGPDDGSAMRARLVRAFDRFHDIAGAGTGAVAALMAAEGVDILVDLKGWTRGARPDLLVRRLAPVQAAWLGYPGPSGCPHMDYLIGDGVVTPPSHQPHYRERLVLLPDAYQPNDRRRPAGDAVPDRAACGLPPAGFVFCCFNAAFKITPALFDAWMRLLARVPGSVLWLLAPHPEAAAALRREAAARGVDDGRLVFAPRLPLAGHLARYRLADLCLDTSPYTGHTTTSDALWMGAPVVTLLGETFASRVAASLLIAAGLPETVARSLPEYEETALALAREPDTLAAFRRRLEAARARSPLWDTPRFARHLEQAYRTMWDRHAAGLPPEPFAVPPLPP
ncbi:MAG TPA: tetratricopeptide repeat protein [Azospirillaceae bacterium]|nr:tetratricopeptide repeat protein [Azospirillaceae bacterium]